MIQVAIIGGAHIPDGLISRLAVAAANAGNDTTLIIDDTPRPDFSTMEFEITAPSKVQEYVDLRPVRQPRPPCPKKIAPKGGYR